jgi:hypothetical protein
MKQNSNSRRSRGRGNGKRPQKIHNFDSNGPEGRVRGNAQQVYEKYLAMARDASSVGDRVATENYFQHAEHYFRILMSQDNTDGRLTDFRNRARNRNQPFGLEEFDDEGEMEGTGGAPSGERDGGDERPQQAREQQDRGERQDRGDRQDRGGDRQERGDRQDRGERQDRGGERQQERGDRPERQERGERNERRNDPRRDSKPDDNDTDDDEGLRRTLAI